MKFFVKNHKDTKDYTTVPLIISLMINGLYIVNGSSLIPVFIVLGFWVLLWIVYKVFNLK